MNIEHWWNDSDSRKSEVFGDKTCLSASAWTGRGLNSGLHGDGQATDWIICVTATSGVSPRSVHTVTDRRALLTAVELVVLQL